MWTALAIVVFVVILAWVVWQMARLGAALDLDGRPLP